MPRKLPLPSLNNLVFFVFMWIVFAMLFSVLCIAYCLLIIQYQAWFGRLKQFITTTIIKPVHKFSVIIPARNEAQNIEACIQSIYSNNYPADFFQVIVVDDFSEDNTSVIVENLQKVYSSLKLIRLCGIIKDPINSYKKKAIETAVENSACDWIITTDADCIVPSTWLSTYNAFIQSSPYTFVAAPVKFNYNGTVLSLFQNLDFMSLQGISAASVSAGFHSMCNGANLAYSKAAFYEVNGFKDVDTIASGDDMLLMQKIKERYPGSIGYLFSSNVTVTTQPETNWKDFFNQRIRWASKATSYTDRKIFLVLLLVYVFNLSFLILFVASITVAGLAKYLIAGLVLKIACELLFLIPVARFFGNQKLLYWFPLMQPVHIIYTIISGWLGKFGKYQWKGRTVK